MHDHACRGCHGDPRGCPGRAFPAEVVDGAQHKVIITAAARKLVKIANALCKSRQKWAALTIWQIQLLDDRPGFAQKSSGRRHGQPLVPEDQSPPTKFRSCPIPLPPPVPYVVISPCRNEAQYMRRTLASMVGQSIPPTQWVIVDDGSTDETPEILAEYIARHDWIRLVKKPDRGHRAVGPGVIEAFYVGLETVDLENFDFLCKLDLDLDLPKRYFEILMTRMMENPRIGTASGKPYMRVGGQLVSERRGDEMSVGMTKFYRVTCFQSIGGFAREVMWDAIDCHKARQLGWTAISWDDPELRFEHLRPMGF